MNHLDFLDTATKLIATENPTEADIRSAISRSYYVVYHHVLLWWQSNERFPNYKDRGHAKIQMALLRMEILAVKDFGSKLKRLNNERRYADYELTMKFDLKRGQALVNLAHHAIVAFDGLDKIALSEGVSNYLRTTNQI